MQNRPVLAPGSGLIALTFRIAGLRFEFQKVRISHFVYIHIKRFSVYVVQGLCIFAGSSLGEKIGDLLGSLQAHFEFPRGDQDHVRFWSVTGHRFPLRLRNSWHSGNRCPMNGEWAARNF